MNIELSYLYRDGANYKKHYSVIFANQYNLPLHVVERAITTSLTDGEWFDARKWGLPDLHFEDWDEEIDHGLHEYESLEETLEIDAQEDIVIFLKSILPVFVMTDQPTTCPKCGDRSKMLCEYGSTKNLGQIHECTECDYMFVEQEDD